MAELVIAAAGAVIGGGMATSATAIVAFGMTGAQLGWMAGSLAGSLLFGQRGRDGPTLSDLKVQPGTYGSDIPQIWGTYPVAGTPIWASDLIPRTQGSKKGGKHTSYAVDCGVAVCEGERTVLRIWANEILIWDTTDGENAKYLPGGPPTFYTGTETELPDALEEAYFGAANCPGYRGIVRVVFDGLELQDFGNRLPLFKFEVAEMVVGARPVATSFGEHYGGVSGSTFEAGMADDGTLWVSSTKGHAIPGPAIGGSNIGPQLQWYDPATKTLLGYVDLSDPAWIGGTGVCYGDKYYIGAGTAGSAMRGLVVSAGGAYTQLNGISTGYPTVPQMLNPAGPEFAVVGYYGSNSVGCIFLGTTYAPSSGLVTHLGIASGVNRVIKTSGRAWIASWYTLSEGTGPSGEGSTTQYTFPYRFGAAVWDEARATIWSFSGTGGDNLYSFGTDMAYKLPDLGASDTHVRGIAIDQRTGNLRILQGVGSPCVIALVDPVAKTVSEVIELPECSFPNDLGEAWDLPSENAVIFNAAGYALWKIPYAGTTTPAQVALSEIVTDVCERAGLATADIDVSALTDLVDGYARGHVMAGRAVIEPLMPPYIFDAVESDWKIKFPKRGAASVATIGADDIVWRGESIAPVTLTRTPEHELPRELTVRAIDQAANYDPIAQYARRLVGSAEGISSMEIPLLMDADFARQTAERGLATAWTARDRFALSASMKHARLDPCDVVTVPYADGTIDMRITEATLGAGTHELRGVRDDNSTYVSVATGVARQVVSAPTIPTFSAVDLELIDTAPLSASDDGLRLYASTAPVTIGGTWAGASLLKSSDGGSSYVSVASAMPLALVGDVPIALPDYDGINTIKYTQTLRVFMRSGTLSSVTELAMLNGANRALVGDEQIQFLTATLIGSNEWELTGILRARGGTEWAASSHVSGERFVLLTPSSIYGMTYALGELGMTRHYKAPAAYQAISDATPVPFAAIGRSARPFSPVHLSVSQWGGDLTFSWVRRARINNEWLDGADVPLDEVTESYCLTIYTDGTYTTAARTFVTSTTSAVYTVAEQASDFTGVALGTVYVGVLQVSSLVGNGYEARAQLSSDDTTISALPTLNLYDPTQPEYLGGIPPTPTHVYSGMGNTPTTPAATTYLPMTADDGPPHGAPLLWDGSRFIATGLYNRMTPGLGFYESTNGLDYTPLTTPDLATPLNILHLHDGVYYGARNVFNSAPTHSYFRSANLVNWTGHHAGSGLVRQFLTLGDGRLLALFAGGEVNTSTDGINWTRHCNVTRYLNWPGFTGTGADVWGIAQGAGKCVAAGGSGSGNQFQGGIWTADAPEGPYTQFLTVSGISLFGTGLYGVKFIDGYFYAYGAKTVYPTPGSNYFVAAPFILRSADASTWVDVTPAPTMGLVGANFSFQLFRLSGGLFINLGSNAFYTSSDGVTWTEIPCLLNYRLGPGNMNVVPGGASNGTIIAAICNLTTYDALANTIQFNFKAVTTSDAVTWTPALASAYIP